MSTQLSNNNQEISIELVIDQVYYCGALTTEDSTIQNILLFPDYDDEFCELNGELCMRTTIAVSVEVMEIKQITDDVFCEKEYIVKVHKSDSALVAENSVLTLRH